MRSACPSHACTTRVWRSAATSHKASLIAAGRIPRLYIYIRSRRVYPLQDESSWEPTLSTSKMWLLFFAHMLADSPPSAGGAPFTLKCGTSGLACPSDGTCCRLANSSQNGWGCCPAAGAICCSGGASCCPSGTKCIASGIADGYTYCSSGEKRRSSAMLMEHDIPQLPTAAIPLHQAPIPRHIPCHLQNDTHLSVASEDGSAELVLAITGQVLSIRSGAVFFPTTFVTSLPAYSAVAVSASYIGNGSVEVVARYPGVATVTQRFSPDKDQVSAIAWSLSIAGEGLSPLTTPVVSSWSFDVTYAAANLSWWAPWDRDSYKGLWVDPLLPSDGGRGFWPGEYKYGIVYGNGPHTSDMVVAPLVAVLDPGQQRGFSVQMSPDDPGTAYAEAWLQSDHNGFAWHREQLQLSLATPQTFNGHIVAHFACWRPALLFHQRAFPLHWEPSSTPQVLEQVPSHHKHTEKGRGESREGQGQRASEESCWE